MKEVYERTGYLLDPHGAVAYLGLKEFFNENKSDALGVILETAHPAKFMEVVEDILSEKIEIPETLQAFGRKEKHSILCPNNYEEIKRIFENY